MSTTTSHFLGSLLCIVFSTYTNAISPWFKDWDLSASETSQAYYSTQSEIDDAIYGKLFPSDPMTMQASLVLILFFFFIPRYRCQCFACELPTGCEIYSRNY